MTHADLFVERDAVISACGKYRYLLRRTWDHDGMRALFVMLNPSTADAEIDDATIRSCIRLCKSWGYGSFEVVNLFGWRATKPADLFDVDDPIGPLNDRTAQAASNRCDVVICAWGAHPMALWMPPFTVERRDVVLRGHMLRRKPAVFCLGTTKAGAPRHPLYIKTGTTPRVYHGKVAA